VTSWHRDERVLWRRSFERIVLLAPGREEPLVLEGTGRLVWELLDEPQRVSVLHAALAELFARDVADVDREVTPFLAELCAAGALVAR
jgi:hypothetical protein